MLLHFTFALLKLIKRSKKEKEKESERKRTRMRRGARTSRTWTNDGKERVGKEQTSRLFLVSLFVWQDGRMSAWMEGY